ncbi:hypothetical protein HYALB_00011787 [Hymenoscyphus albidus]|uniref:RRM domain-containing protein n=1 Tax=Hymenoscyphus albidus TaxID=595503 RepID=A0A9N9LFB6_9HELO|nr:hypothetical protein HYALB_00011787 [Hymenoscyphus albidus]
MESWTSIPSDQWTPETITPDLTPADSILIAPLKFKRHDVPNRKPASSSLNTNMQTPVYFLPYSQQRQVCAFEDCKRDTRKFGRPGDLLANGVAQNEWGGRDRSHSRNQYIKNESKESHYLKVVDGENVHLIEGELESVLHPFCRLPYAMGAEDISSGDVVVTMQQRDSSSPTSNTDVVAVLDYTSQRLRPRIEENVRSQGQISKFIRKRLAETQSLVDSDDISHPTESSSVSCTWYRSSSSAQLSFKSSRKAHMAQEVLERHLLFGRIISLHLLTSENISSDDSGKALVTLIVGNLDSRTSRDHFEEILTGKLTPDNISIGSPENFADTEAATMVKRLLRQHGTISSFQFKLVDTMSTKIRAYATFDNQEGAISAVNSLHSMDIGIRTGSLLSVKHIISINFRIPLLILDFYRTELRETHYEFWEDGHLQYKIYQPIDYESDSVGLRLFGDTAEKIAESKKSAESFLNGTIIMTAYSPIWHKYFLKSGSVEHLEELQRIYGLYIRYDTKQYQVLIYGGSPYQRKEIQHQLKRRIENLRRRTRQIGLLPPSSINQSNFRIIALSSS